MKCPYCRRPVRMFAFERKHLLRKILPYCRICNRYVLSWVHLILIVGLVIAVLVLALKLVPPI